MNTVMDKLQLLRELSIADIKELELEIVKLDVQLQCRKDSLASIEDILKEAGQ